MQARQIICIILLSLSIVSFGQTDPATGFLKDKLTDPYQRYFTYPREQVYIHFNKSIYFPGDEIWFKCYVFDPQTKMPSFITKNLITELYDGQGKLVGQKILFVNNGTADNVFNISLAKKPGAYTFRAYSSWMKNFTDLDPFTAKIVVAGEEEQDTLKREMQYDIQFFPESGTLLAGQFNKVAVKALDSNGKGVSLKGIIVNESGDTVCPVSLNTLGMGEMTINVLQNTAFTCKFMLPGGKVIEYPLPPVSIKGILAQVNPYFKNKVAIRIASNEQAIDSKRMFYLLIHNNGVIAKSALFSLDPGHVSQTLEFKKEELFNGVNCLTVFDDQYQPVAERLFFVKNAGVLGKVNIEKTMEGDSLTLNLRVSDTTGNPGDASLSLSVLHEETESNHFTNSLLSETILKSGVKGFIENPMYYFGNDDFNHQVALDDLLLTQGWRKYSWQEILKEKPGALSNTFDQGFSVEGKIKNWFSGKMERRSQVVLFSPENSIFNIQAADSLGRYAFNNLYLADSTAVVISALSNKGKGWNRSVSTFVKPIYIQDSLITVPKHYVAPTAVTDNTPVKLLKGVIQLKEVRIIGQRKPKPFENSLYRPINGRTYEITKENYNRYQRIEDLLIAEFNVLVRHDEGTITVDMRRGITSLMNPAQPVLIVDDMRMFDLSMLDILNVQEIEAIAVNKGPDAMLGMNGSAGSIMIKTRKTPIDWGPVTPSNLQSMRVKGYAKPVAFYTPKYALPPSAPEYKKYAAVYWKSSIIADSTGVTKVTFMVPRGVPGLDIRIEGMSGNGSIYLDERKINLR